MLRQSFLRDCNGSNFCHVKACVIIFVNANDLEKLRNVINIITELISRDLYHEVSLSQLILWRFNHK